jgi:predicted ATPase
MRSSFSSGSLLLKELDAAADGGQKSVEESTMQFTFAHPLVHKILYDLTPVSIKNSIHASLARDIEEKYPENSIYFSSLGYRKCTILLLLSVQW